ncbi:Cullin-4 [Psilocybe cubensis]|uniref:Cullin family profile domain-containing protein n=2 Tax=Psilocybe cubensis TaxID=181762 RepID=A0A8H8CS33_PSICU|nr:Cullin-4 [Psilocybe cubensis]KAH9487336.1 Cullin-4 [Psilocybe cubensis]
MATLFALLSLPKTSEGLTALRPTVVTEQNEGSASPPRKVARLTADSDSASASRSKTTTHIGGSLQIRVIGDYKSKENPKEKQLNVLRRCIKTILTREPGPHDIIPATYENIYNTCHSVVSDSDCGEQLYNILKIELQQSIGQLSRNLLSSPEKEMTWLFSFNAALKWLETQISLLISLLTYLDQVYVIREKNVQSIHDLAYSMVASTIFGNAQVIGRMRSDVKSWLNWERANNRPHRDREVIPALIEHLLRHHQYSPFEEYYIDITRTFYLEESSFKSVALKADPQLFFDEASARIREEIERSNAVLPVATWSIVREVTENSLWKGRLEWLANATLSSYMDTKNFEKLGSMYALFSRVDGTKALCDAFAAHIRTRVANIVQDVDRDDDMVQRLLDFKDVADQATTRSFLAEKSQVTVTNSSNIPITPIASASELPAKQPDQQFLYALTDAFTIGFKSRRSKPAEMIAKYVDKSMRKGQGKLSDAEFQDMLDKVLALYRYTDDKDVFRTFYHRGLAKRLLLEKSASDDFEKAMLKKLKEKYDPEFGMGEDMFKDLALSRESIREYHSRLPEDSPGHKLTAMVLQRSAWPFSAQKDSIDLPPGMQEELTKYTDYYKSKHTGHVLAWNHSLGTATLKARFNTGAKELTVSLYQAIVLLLFNESPEIPYADIKEQTSMDEAELKRTLQSLACGKKKVLKKVPVGRDVDDTDVFHFNPDFKDPHPKVHINSIQAKVSPEESKKTNASIEDDRKHYLDAAIVRVMKARKEMTYEQLKAATIDAVKNHFVPQVETIKRRIDTLVETEYLERSETDRSVYKYIA